MAIVQLPTGRRYRRARSKPELAVRVPIGLRRDDLPALYDAILHAALSETQRLVVALFTDGYTVAEVAALLEMRTGTVATALGRARRRAAGAGLDPGALRR